MDEQKLIELYQTVRKGLDDPNTRAAMAPDAETRRRVGELYQTIKNCKDTLDEHKEKLYDSPIS